MKTHQFWLDLGDLGKFEPQVSDKAMKKVLYHLYPNYDSFPYESKRSAWREVRNRVYQSLKKGYEKKYSTRQRLVLTTWKSKEYQHEPTQF